MTVQTRRAIVHLLKQNGPLNAQELAARLHVSAMAVRQHLYALQEEQLVTYHELPRHRHSAVESPPRLKPVV